MASVRRRHATNGLPRTEESAGHVDGEHASDPFGVHGLHARPPGDDAGVVHQRIETPEPGVDLSEHPAHVGLGGHVGLHRDCHPASLGDGAHDRLRRCGIREEIDHHRVAVCGGETRGRCANPAAATRDEQDSVLRQHGNPATPGQSASAGFGATTRRPRDVARTRVSVSPAVPVRAAARGSRGPGAGRRSRCALPACRRRRGSRRCG